VQYQLLIVSGELPCSKEEAATLAAIQLHVDEAWPDYADDDDDDTTMATDPVQSGDYDHQILIDHNGPCPLGAGRAVSRRQRAGGTPPLYRQNRRTKLTTSRRHGPLTARCSPAGRCIDGENGVRSCFRLPDGAMARCLPPDYRSSRSVRQLIEVSTTSSTWWRKMNAVGFACPTIPGRVLNFVSLEIIRLVCTKLMLCFINEDQQLSGNLSYYVIN